MATNLVYPNVGTLSLPVLAGTVSGDPVRAGTTPTAVNGINGVALTDRSGGLPANPTGYATVATTGAFDVSVATNVAAAGALAIGDVVYMDALGVLSSDSVTAGQMAWGIALEAKTAAGAASVIIVAIIPSV